MNKHIYLIVGLFLLSSHSLFAASAADSSPLDDKRSYFLDGFKPDATAETLFHITSTFCRDFIGIEPNDPEKEFYLIGIGWATRGLTSGGVDVDNATTWRSRRDTRIAELKRPHNFIVHGAVQQSIPYPLHSVSALDMKVAEALYCLVYVNKDVLKSYHQVEKAVWGVLPVILGISQDPSTVDAKNLAAMDLWTFLTFEKVIAAVTESNKVAEKKGLSAIPLLPLHPCNPPAKRLSENTSGVPCADKAFLAEFFNQMVAAYQSALA